MYLQIHYVSIELTFSLTYNAVPPFDVFEAVWKIVYPFISMLFKKPTFSCSEVSVIARISNLGWLPDINSFRLSSLDLSPFMLV